MTPTILIAGCGDIGRRVAALWQARGAAVYGLVRSAASAEALAAAGIEPIVGDLDAPESLPPLPAAEVLYHFVPPPRHGETDPRLTALLARLDAGTRPQRMVYLGTSGVYGDRRGAWVDEATPPEPQTGRARRRLAAENSVRSWGLAHGIPVTLLRVGGIYGPGRWPLERLRAGRPVLREAECGYTNRIHADDLAEVAVAAGGEAQGVRVYNVSDGNPGSMTGYFFAVADAFGLPRPPEVTLTGAEGVLSPEMLSYLTESRRMDNRRMLAELGVALHYPDLAAGLAAAGKREG